MIFNSNSKEETQSLASEILDNLAGRNVVLLSGELGAGKTTFAQGLLKRMGAKGPFTSPTFVIMKKYETGKVEIANNKFQTNRKDQIPAGFLFAERQGPENPGPKLQFKNVYHIDAYRVAEKDVLELGWEEIINEKSNLILVEWPERIGSILPKEYVKLNFEIKEDEKREVAVKWIGKGMKSEK